MNIVSYGGGTNSTAMLIELIYRKIPVDLILFADTGGERPETYEYVKMFSQRLKAYGYPEIITVKRVTREGIEETLEQECLRTKNLPSIAYGFKTCSGKYKIAPQDKYMNNYQPAKDAWKRGEKITKFVGFDADEAHRIKDYDDDKYKVEYPLVDWDMGRDECIETIKKEGLCLPGKSACFFCPSSRAHEIRSLPKDLQDRAIAMEKNADLTSMKGLGRSYSWTNLLATEDMFDNNIEIDCGCYDG